jgi:hypothetical protein
VTRTASASWFMPRSSPRRASSSNSMILGIPGGPSIGRQPRGCFRGFVPASGMTRG